MSRRVVDLACDQLGAVPGRCGECLFWELGHPRPIELRGSAAEAAERKAAWWRSVEADHGRPGRLLRVDGEIAGWCLFGEPRVFAYPRGAMPRASTDALLLATAWVEPAFRGSGLGRLLLQTAVKETLRRDRRALEAYGDRRHREGACVLPCTWLLHEGLAVHRDHPRYPLLRLDVRTVARWAESLEQALEQALARLGRRGVLEPVPGPGALGTGPAGR